MTDVLERLRADNPVPQGSPPPFDRVWGSALDRPSRRGRTAGARAAACGALALVPVAIVAVIAVTTLGHRPASAGAGASSGAFVVHYRVRTERQLTLHGRTLPADMITVDDVWVSGRTAHWFEYRSFASGRRSGRVAPVEFATDGRVVASFTPPTPANPNGELVEVEAGAGPRCSLLVLFCPPAPRDPAAALRTAFDRGAVVFAARDVLLGGRRVDELRRRGSGTAQEIFVQRGTFIPVEFNSGLRGPHQGADVAVITDYERLPMTTANRRALQMSAHPGAALCTALPGPRGITRVAGPDSCFFATPVAVGGRRPVLARPLPAALYRSFHVLRGVAVGEMKTIPNSLGWKTWVIPWRDHTCLTAALPSNGPAGIAQSGDCVTNAMLMAGKFSPGWFSPGETVIGLAPNGNRTVTITLADGSSRTVPVYENVYTVRTYRIIRTVTLKDSAGRLQTWNVPDGAPG